MGLITWLAGTSGFEKRIHQLEKDIENVLNEVGYVNERAPVVAKRLEEHDKRLRNLEPPKE